MKRFTLYLIPAMLLLASCGNKPTLADLKKQRAALDAQIATMEKEAEKGAPKPVKVTPVSVITMKPNLFNGVVEVQSSVMSDENIVAAPQAAATVKSVLVKVGQHVNKGQLLATLDVSAIDRQIDALQPNLTLTKTLYEKQQRLWEQNIGTEVQLMAAKTNYESIEKNIEALKAQRDLYRILAPISGVVDEVNLKVGDFASPATASMGVGIRLVNFDKLKAEAMVGENYLGKIKEGDAVNLVFPNINDSFTAHISYVTKSVNALSRSFTVQVALPNNAKMHPNMSCIMKIINYTNPKALVVPVYVLQKTQEGTMVYVVENGTAKAVPVTTGIIANGNVEITSGLQEGNQVIVAGYEELENGQKISMQ